MADKDFVVKNGLVVNSNVLVVNGANVGVNTTTPDAVFTVAGTANLQGNVTFTGNEINAVANVTFVGNVHTKNNVFIDKKLYVGNTATMVQDLPTIIQAVDNFNGFVMVSSQNLSQLDDACADLLIYADNTNGLSNFNDLGINNSKFDGRIHRIIVNSTAGAWQLGETVFQRNGAGANIAVGQIRDIVTVNATAVSLRIRVSEDDGLETYVGMSDFANTVGSNLSLRAVTSAANADILHAVPFFSPNIIEGYSRRNYAFTVGKNGDGYLYNANSALTIGTTAGGIRNTSLTLTTTFTAGVNTIVLSTGNTRNIRADMDITGTGIATGTWVTSIVNSTAFKISKPTTDTGSGSITARDEYYDLSEANNPIIFHVGGMMSKNEIARFSGTGNFTIGPNTTNRDSKLTVNGTANLVGQVNVGANVNVTGNINATANVNAARGIYTTSVNVGIVTLGTTQANVGANVVLDAAGLKITGNTLIPSMNVSGGNITVGNTTVANSPTIQLTNTISSANVTPAGLATGNIVVNALGSTVNVGANAWLNATHFAMGNATSNVVIAPSDPNWVLSVKGDARVNGNLLVKGDATVNGALIFANTVSVNGDFKPASNDAFDLGNSSLTWGAAYIKVIQVPTTGNVTVGNSTLNSVSYFDSVRISNSAGSFANLNIGSLTVGNTTVNGQYTSSASRIGNATVNSVLSSTSLVIGNSTVNSTVNSSAFLGNVVAIAISGNLTGNVAATTITGNLTGNVAAVTITGNLTGNVAATTITGNLTGNVAAVTISGNLTGNVIATTINAVSVNATTVNAANIQVGTAFKANSTQVITANLSVLGNFQVTGTTTFVNTAVMDVTDINITLGKGAANPAAADGGGMTLEGANVSFNYSAASGNWVSNTGISVGNSSVNVTTNSSAFIGNTIGVHVGNVVATTITGNLTGNVVATTISGNLTGNVTATTITTSRIDVGTDLTINNSRVWFVNSTARSLLDADSLSLGNSSVVSTPRILVQNTSGATSINANFVSTTSISGNLTGNVSATTIGASANISLGSNVVANTSGNFASHLGGFAAANYVKFSGSGDVGLDDGGTNSSITAVAGAVVFSNATGMAVTASGTSGQVLTSAGSGTPTWTSQASLSVGTAANLGSFAASSYQLNSTLAANVATMTALNANNLGGTAASAYDKFPSGTRLLFQQTTAPTGWTKDVTHDNKALRIVSGSVSSGGSLGFTAAFTSRSVAGTTVGETVAGTTSSRSISGTTGSTILNIQQIPSHYHLDGYGSDGAIGSYGYETAASAADYDFTGTSIRHMRTSSAGGNLGHDHSFNAGSHDHTFNAGSHSHTYSSTLDMAVAYVDAVICYKN